MSDELELGVDIVDIEDLYGAFIPDPKISTAVELRDALDKWIEDRLPPPDPAAHVRVTVRAFLEILEESGMRRSVIDRLKAELGYEE